MMWDYRGQFGCATGCGLRLDVVIHARADGKYTAWLTPAEPSAVGSAPELGESERLAKANGELEGSVVLRRMFAMSLNAIVMQVLDRVMKQHAHHKRGTSTGGVFTPLGQPREERHTYPAFFGRVQLRLPLGWQKIGEEEEA